MQFRFPKNQAAEDAVCAAQDAMRAAQASGDADALAAAARAQAEAQENAHKAAVEQTTAKENLKILPLSSCVDTLHCVSVNQHRTHF